MVNCPEANLQKYSKDGMQMARVRENISRIVISEGPMGEIGPYKSKSRRVSQERPRLKTSGQARLCATKARAGPWRESSVSRWFVVLRRCLSVIYKLH